MSFSKSDAFRCHIKTAAFGAVGEGTPTANTVYKLPKGKKFRKGILTMRKQALKWLLCLALVLSMVPAAMAASSDGPCNAAEPEAHLEWENAQSLNAVFDSTEVTAAVTSLNGYYYLEDNLELTSTSSGLTRFFEIASGKDVTICLNGYSLSGSYQSTGTCVFMRVYGKLNICDCKGTGTVTYVSESTKGGSTINTKSGCTVNVYGGDITGNTNPRYGTIFGEGGTFTLHANGKITGNSTENSGSDNKYSCFYLKSTTVYIYGEVSDNHNYVSYGGAFDLRSGAKVYLYDGGKISDNSASGAGGAIYIQGGVFYMEGGEISGNESGSAGGGIRIYSGSLRLKKGVIENNVAATNGGGVSSRRDTTITGTTITGNTAPEGGGFYYDGANEESSTGNVFNMSAGSITGNTATEGVADDLYITGGYQTLIVSGGTVDSLYVAPEESVTVSGGTVSNIYNDGTLTISGGEIAGLTVGDNATDTILTGGTFDQEYTDCTMGEGLSFVTTKSGELAVAGDFHGGDNSNMVLKQNLDMNLYFEGMEKTPAKAMVYMGEKAAFEVKPVADDTRYVVTVPVAAKEMSTEIEIELFDSKGNLISVASDSVKEYGERMLADPDQSAVHSLIVDMLNYGAAAQQYLAAAGEEIGTLANAGIDAYQTLSTDVTDEFAAAYANWGNVTFAGNRAYSSANLTLDNDVDFNLYFWVGQIGDDKSFTYTINGEEKTGTFSETLDGELLYKVKIADLAVADLANAEVSITFTDLDGEKTITDSVYNYLVRNDGYGKWAQDSADEFGLSKALMAFATSAAAYNA